MTLHVHHAFLQLYWDRAEIVKKAAFLTVSFRPGLVTFTLVVS